MSKTIKTVGPQGSYGFDSWRPPSWRGFVDAIHQSDKLPVPENVADHDHEHLGHITKTLASGGTSR